MPPAEPFLVYEDDSLIAMHKPCGLHTAPLPSGGGPSLCSWVFERWPGIAFDSSSMGHGGGRGSAEGGLFHRLDQETSGLVLFAKAPEVLRNLLEAQEAGLVEKHYRALASRSNAIQPGALPGLGAPVGLDRDRWEAFLDALVSTGSDWSSAQRPVAGPGICRIEIECRFRPFGPSGSRVACLAIDQVAARRRRGTPERSYGSEIVALRPRSGSSPPSGGPGCPPGILELFLLIRRGFRHQVRAQLAWLGLPLAGDGLYGGVPASRLHLHAESIRFPHPSNGALTGIEDIARLDFA